MFKYEPEKTIWNEKELKQRRIHNNWKRVKERENVTAIVTGKKKH